MTIQIHGVAVVGKTQIICTCGAVFKSPEDHEIHAGNARGS